jgi:hypothetical protein
MRTRNMMLMTAVMARPIYYEVRSMFVLAFRCLGTKTVHDTRKYIGKMQFLQQSAAIAGGCRRASYVERGSARAELQCDP